MFEHVKAARLWRGFQHQLEDFFWQVSTLSTNDTYDVQQSSKTISILWSSRSSNTPCSLNSPNLSSNGKMPKSEAKNYVKPSKQRWGLTRWRDVLVNLVRACQSRETLERLSTSSGGFLTSFNDLRKWYSCYVQQWSSLGRVPSHAAESPHIPTAHWTPQIYYRMQKCNSLRQKTM